MSAEVLTGQQGSRGWFVGLYLQKDSLVSRTSNNGDLDEDSKLTHGVKYLQELSQAFKSFASHDTRPSNCVHVA